MKKIKIEAGLTGTRPIMFDRFESMKTELTPLDKVYAEDGFLYLPSKNIMSFLGASNTESAPKRIMGKKWKTIAKAALSFVNIIDDKIFFIGDNGKIKKDSNQIYIDSDKAIVMKGSLAIPSPKERPVLKLPWGLNFKIELFDNVDLNEAILRRLFDEGGITIGLGTFRGVYGKFELTKWEIK